MIRSRARRALFTAAVTAALLVVGGLALLGALAVFLNHAPEVHHP